MGRAIVAVVTGCAIVGVASVGFFWVSGHSPGVLPTAGYAAAYVIVGLIAAIAAGWTTARLARGNQISHALMLAMVMMGAGLASFLFDMAGVKWAQMLMMFVFAPAAFGGGMIAGQRAEGTGRGRGA